MASHVTGEIYPPAQIVQTKSHVPSMEEYNRLYKQSIEEPGEFWGDIASQFYWKNKWASDHSMLKYNFDITKDRISIEWMKGAVTNICYNCLDKHVQENIEDKIAFYWEGNDPADTRKITYKEIFTEVCKFSNVLKKLVTNEECENFIKFSYHIIHSAYGGVAAGDRVCIYMPMVIELVIAMLACARIAAIHSIVFAGFSADSLAGRLLDSKCDVLITSDGVYRGTKFIKLEEIADNALAICTTKGLTPKNCIVFRNLTTKKNETDQMKEFKPKTAECSWHEWADLMSTSSDICEPEWVDAEQVLFMLYTSGSTAKPKGVVHTHGGYMLYSATTFKYSFDFHPDDIYFCTADIGWITGHTYITYGPLLNRATSVLFEGVPTYPDASRFWTIIDNYQVSKFYTAPTAIRTLMKFGKGVVEKSSRQSLKVLGTVGEPINPEVWLWYYTVIGEKRCAIVDTWWQTETGGHMITSLPGCTPMKPGSASFPFFGVIPAIVDEDGNELIGEASGYLVIKKPWPGIMRTIYEDHERFESTYFKKFPGYYLTGDGCYRDKEGYLWLTGRTDDVLNVSGHRLSTAELESALVEHPSIVEAAVVSCEHEIKGEGIYCFVTLKQDEIFSESLAKSLREQVRNKVSAIASPDFIREAPGLPKTRSGKIMRRILRKIARNDKNFGDISTLADSSVIDHLFSTKLISFS